MPQGGFDLLVIFPPYVALPPKNAFQKNTQCSDRLPNLHSMIFLYQAIFYRPILNVLVYFYETIAGRDFGVAIILATLLIRLVLYPLFHKGAKHQMALQRLQPKIKKIQEIHKDDKKNNQKLLWSFIKSMA